jgi:hypothetical protein
LRSRLFVATAIVIAALFVTPASAHRRDEYLQAARIAIDPGRVEIELDLTPGITVAPDVITHLDADRDGSFTLDEARAYAARVLRDIQASVDGKPLTLTIAASRAPGIDEMLRGEGAVRFTLTAPLEPLTAGVHRLSYSNRHRPDIGVYLANALTPSSARVAVLSQARDEYQRDLVVEYVLRDGIAPSMWGFGIAGLGLAVWIWWRTRP